MRVVLKQLVQGAGPLLAMWNGVAQRLDLEAWLSLALCFLNLSVPACKLGMGESPLWIPYLESFVTERRACVWPRLSCPASHSFAVGTDKYREELGLVGWSTPMAWRQSPSQSESGKRSELWADQLPALGLIICLLLKAR